MGGFEETRKQIWSEIKNEDLRYSALLLADAIERMSNIYSNRQMKRGIKNFDLPELVDLIEHSKDKIISSAEEVKK